MQKLIRMQFLTMGRRFAPWLAVLLCLLLLTSPGWSAGKDKAPGPPPAKPKATAPQPDKILKQACDLLKSAKKFSFKAEVTDDRVYTGSKKLQFAFDLEAFVSRPDKLRINAAGDLENKQFFYNGKTITLYEKPKNIFATMKAPGTIEAALRQAHQEYGLRVALADLTGSDGCALMTAGLKHALYVGKGLVRGVKCHHLAFDKKNIQWQIWIDAGEKPLIRKLLITEKKLPASPQWTAYFTEWNFAPQFADNLFVFAPPPGASKVKFISLEEAAALHQKVSTPVLKKGKKKKKGDK